MGTALIKMKLMPLSPETDLEGIKETAKSIIEQKKGERCVFEEQPIAFGLNAIIIGFEIDESVALEPIEQALKNIENVNSTEIIDMRRAFG